MQESLEQLALQESLLEVIQRRMAHVFTGARTFQSAWAEIESKYGNPGLIIQAHNQHLQQLAPFKTVDFSGLFDMAKALHDAVSSVSPDNCIMFTSAIGSLPAKMLMHLQTDSITRSFADRLNLKGYTTAIRFGSFASSTLLDTSVVSFRLRSAEGKNFFAPDEAFVVPNINLSHRKINGPKVKYGWPHLASLQLPAIDSTKVELLVEIDLPSAHQTLRVITPRDNEDGPSADETCFGYAVVGKIPRSLVSGPILKVDVNLGSAEVEPLLATTVERFQSNQSFGVVLKSKSKKSQEEEDRQMLDVIKRSKKFVGCGYEIELPIRPEVSVVPNN